MGLACTGNERQEELHLSKGLTGDKPPGQHDGLFSSGVSLSGSCVTDVAVSRVQACIRAKHMDPSSCLLCAKPGVLQRSRGERTAPWNRDAASHSLIHAFIVQACPGYLCFHQAGLQPLMWSFVEGRGSSEKVRLRCLWWLRTSTASQARPPAHMLSPKVEASPFPTALTSGFLWPCHVTRAAGCCSPGQNPRGRSG